MHIYPEIAVPRPPESRMLVLVLVLVLVLCDTAAAAAKTGGGALQPQRASESYLRQKRAGKLRLCSSQRVA